MKRVKRLGLFLLFFLMCLGIFWVVLDIFAEYGMPWYIILAFSFFVAVALFNWHKFNPRRLL
ncbi:MAG: hypothetical protein A3G59_00505 [Candidatus Taylorbacteria bacterium RIFCSPLOWO2_12_FULL_47_20]|uniref:Uncharacterized protein n=2 Tax=Candidatus Tayloriibacteriota TaxID=1817919 RepID=A0A1G2P4N6_9BACT|nr:MAG: hypothetical protein A3H68_01900 [Candidatus Taylorbacteria bacterium RIFCSPLOWO2_02_FULL_46_40]OHA43223.1 MAG: hypothetical protein A3G59_00505 [Candidatus Taylorbacteria bacterium RIFCSPLOWO2_12_FULL_47_20]